MRVLLRNWASLVIATSLMVVGTASRADELLVIVRLHMLCDSPEAFVKEGSGSVAV
jgi:hypothetical protein